MKKYLIADLETRDLYGEDFSAVFNFTLDCMREIEKIDEGEGINFEWCGKWLIAGERIPPEMRKEPLLDDIDRRFRMPNAEPAVSVYRRAALDHRDLAIALKKLSVIFKACK